MCDLLSDVIAHLFEGRSFDSSRAMIDQSARLDLVRTTGSALDISCAKRHFITLNNRRVITSERTAMSWKAAPVRVAEDLRHNDLDDRTRTLMILEIRWK